MKSEQVLSAGSRAHQQFTLGLLSWLLLRSDAIYVYIYVCIYIYIHTHHSDTLFPLSTFELQIKGVSVKENIK